MNLKTSISSFALGMVLVALGVGSMVESPSASPAPSPLLLNAAGASFPYPIYAKWFTEYNRIHPDIQINYNSIGSGGGIRQLLAGTVDFGASDAPMTDDQQKQSKVPVLHFPTVLGAVVPTYNLEGIQQDVKFTGEVLADIFMGKITKWNDPALASLNTGLKLPDTDIVVVHRSDSSGTSYVWTDYLYKVSNDWESKVGRNTAVNWPVGLGGKGNEGVAGLVKQTPGAIGYVELIYAIQTSLPYGAVKNSAGVFEKASLDGVTAAAASEIKNIPADFRVSITNAPGRASYPICSFTYLLIPSKFDDPAKKQAVKDFLHWMLTEGQNEAAGLYYAKLPKEVVTREMKAIAQIN